LKLETWEAIMSRKWLLFLFCLLLLPIVAPLSRAGLTLRVNEPAITVSFQHRQVEVALAVENSLGAVVDQKVLIELIDPENRIKSSVDQIESIARGTQTVRVVLPYEISKLPEKDRRQLLWYRLHYRLTTTQTPFTVSAEGFVSLSQIAPDFFEVRVAATEMAHEAMRYQARVQTIHPLTKKPAPAVRIDAVLTLETDDQGGGVKIAASGVTDSKGYSILLFDLPVRFPEFPHDVRPAGGSLKVTAQRGGLVAEVENDVMVDQFPRILVSTDKPIYQPGQKLHMRAVALSPTKHALVNQDVDFRIDDPEDTNVFRESVKSSRFGVASIDWAIPENARLGDYWLKVALGAGEDSSKTFVKVRISRYDLPNFSVKAQPDHSYYLPGQSAEVKVTADYLFGQRLTRGHVRVVREVDREWNYKEQKWDIEEGDKYEGNADSTGVFLAHVNLGEDHEDIADSDYRRFKDVTYAAYFTDPTTNRTEQRRFDLRVTRDPIHVYVIKNEDLYRHTPKLPLEFYVSTFYADGAPAPSQVTIGIDDDDDEDTQLKQLLTLRTNRYGLAKVSGLRLPSKLLEGNVELAINARDSRGRKGSHRQDFYFGDDEDEVRVETDKSLYRPGEPIVASITSSISDLRAVVDVARDTMVLSSQTVRLHDGQAQLTIPYRPEFTDQVTIAAYADFAERSGMISRRTILYPRNHDLKIEAQPMAASYRPGDEATIGFRVRGAQGGTASALGLAIVDKAVDERFHTDGEFGNQSWGFYGSIRDVLGSDDQVAGFTLRDLERVNMSKAVSPDFELVAEILLGQNQKYRPVFFGGDAYEDQRTVFAGLTQSQITPVRSALAARFANTGRYPNDESQLRALLANSGIDLQTFRDPWGNPYRPIFSIDKQADVLSFESSGADKLANTDDDFRLESNRWLYFLPIGKAIDKAVRAYHKRTGGFIRDFATLRVETGKEGYDPDALRDRWDQPYRIAFDVVRDRYVITLRSGGPDKQFVSDQYYNFGDDFAVWTSEVYYFAETRERINDVLTERLKKEKRFPQNEQELSEAFRDSDQPLESLRDPWGHAYYATFKIQSYYSDRIEIENRARLGETPVPYTKVTPVTSTAAVITLRSMGADGEAGTPDDFDVANFRSVLTEQTGNDAKPRVIISPIVFSGAAGAISGVITDATGAFVSGAKITATRAEDSQSYSTSSDDSGRYVFANIPPGLYEVRVDAANFKSSVTTGILLNASAFVEVNIVLEAGQVSETVTVTASGAESVQTSVSNLSLLAPQNNRRMPNRKDFVTVTKSGESQASTPRLREYFPETLLWQPSLETDEQGRAQLKFKLADNITTWKMSVIASTEDGRIGTVEKEIRAFQPFFVEHDPPRVLTEGDEISLPIVVRNYLERAQNVNLEIKPESWFALLGPATKSLNVPAGDASRETFDFRANQSVKDGKQRITAMAADANDAIEKPVTVHPDGEGKSVTAGDIVSEKGNLTIDIPPAAIPNSIRAELKIYPNLLGHVAESVEAIMERPYGCGEQTISSTYPSLLLLRNYKQTGQDSPLRAKAERYVRAGYARLLNYRDESGGFTYWGRGNPDLALTAYALRFLSDAREIIPVDEDAIKGARTWLIKQQRADGSWGAPYDWDKVEDKRRSAMLTAHIARILAITAESASIDGTDSKANQKPLKVVAPALKRALDYLAKRTDEIDEPYLIASYALAALEIEDKNRARSPLQKLQALAHEEQGQAYWSLETNTPFYGWGMAGRIETTALAVQALARANDTAETDRLVRSGVLFLLRQKDRYGVWYSTQATINVLDTLLVLLSRDVDRTRDSAATSSAEITINGKNIPAVELPSPNRLTGPVTVDLTQFLKAGANQLEIRRGAGGPPASVQAVATYYLPWQESLAMQNANPRPNGSSRLRLTAKFDKTEAKISDEITCHVEAERIGFHGYGMMLAEIGLPPGADVDRASLDLAMTQSEWSINQYDVLPDRVIVYLWPRAGGIKFNFKFKPRFGLKAQTAAAVLYDYYNPDARAVLAPTRFVVK
jgi:hypothetical protein